MGDGRSPGWDFKAPPAPTPTPAPPAVEIKTGSEQSCNLEGSSGKLPWVLFYGTHWLIQHAGDLGRTACQPRWTPKFSTISTMLFVLWVGTNKLRSVAVLLVLPPLLKDYY